MKKKTELKVWISFALALLALVLGGNFPFLLLADYGPPVALRYALIAVPLIFLPFLIGWLTPAHWWLALGGSLLPLMFVMLLLASDKVHSLSLLLARLPGLLPTLLTLAFALLGRWLGRRRASRSPAPPQ